MQIISKMESGMKKSIDALSDRYALLRTNRVHPDILNNITVSINGSNLTLRALALVHVQGRDLLVTPFDSSNIKEISREIQKSKLNLNPIADKKVIRVPFPTLDVSLRESLVKQAKTDLEKFKVAVRDFRNKANTSMKKEALSKDDLEAKSKEIQKIADKFCKDADKLFAQKKEDILKL